MVDTISLSVVAVAVEDLDLGDVDAVVDLVLGLTEVLDTLAGTGDVRPNVVVVGAGGAVVVEAVVVVLELVEITETTRRVLKGARVVVTELGRGGIGN